MSRYFVRTLLLLSFSSSVVAQEAILNSPFWVNKTYINSSYTGDYEKPVYAGFLTTKQLWVGIEGAPRVNGFSLNNKFNKNIILLTLREMTNLTTKEIRSSMKRYKVMYVGLIQKMVK